MTRASWLTFSELLDDVLRRRSAFAGRMTETAAAHAILNVEDKIIALPRREAHRHGIEMKRVSRFPSDHMIGAGSIAAHSQRADELAPRVVERQPSAKNNRATNC